MIAKYPTLASSTHSSAPFGLQSRQNFGTLPSFFPQNNNSYPKIDLQMIRHSALSLSFNPLGMIDEFTRHLL